MPARKRRLLPGWMLLGFLIACGIAVSLVLSTMAPVGGKPAKQSKTKPAAARTATKAQPTGVPFTIGGRQYLIDLPTRCKRAENSSSVAFLCPPGVRSPQTIGIAAAGVELPAVPTPSKSLTLGPGRTLTYGTAHRDGGSGGQEVTLSGRLTVGGATLVVTCSAQGELTRPPADWCLPHLRTIRAR